MANHLVTGFIQGQNAVKFPTDHSTGDPIIREPDPDHAISILRVGTIRVLQVFKFTRIDRFYRNLVLPGSGCIGQREGRLRLHAHGNVVYRYVISIGVFHAQPRNAVLGFIKHGSRQVLGHDDRLILVDLFSKVKDLIHLIKTARCTQEKRGGHVGDKGGIFNTAFRSFLSHLSVKIQCGVGISCYTFYLAFFHADIGKR